MTHFISFMFFLANVHFADFIVICCFANLNKWYLLQVHDAYIECAEMLLTSDPLAAVDVYAKFPVSEQLSFDDAYIFGEIVRILMKHEKYDDERLAKNMISYGRILGLGTSSFPLAVDLFTDACKNRPSKENIAVTKNTICSDRKSS